MTTHSHKLTPRQLCDLELIHNGGFAPLTTFLSQADYQSVVQHCRLHNHTLWPIPVVLDIATTLAERLTHNDTLQLLDSEGHIIATLTVHECYTPDKLIEAQAVYGTTDPAHPGVRYLLHNTEAVYVSGPLHVLAPPPHFNFAAHYHTPTALKAFFAQHHWQRVVGFQTRNPLHRAHQELTLRAMQACDAHLLLHPVVGQTKPGDIESHVRIKCYQLMLKRYPEHSVTLSLLPLAMRMAGPREALWHALIRHNYGCTHFIVGRDHAGPGHNAQGKAFYAPEAAQHFVAQFADELPLQVLPFSELQYVKSKARYHTQDEIAADPSITSPDIATLSGSELRERLRTDQAIPEWFSYPEIIQQLRKAELPRAQLGLTIFFTGLPSSGKSTLANALLHRLMELTDRTVSLLDGDLFRQLFSTRLGYSKADRDENVKRVGYIATEITKHRGIAICALIAPYADARLAVREMVSQHGHFVEIYNATPLAACEARDPKGLYRKARSQQIQHFTGVDDPYEPPLSPEITLNTDHKSVAECVEEIIRQLPEFIPLPPAIG